MNKRCVKEEVDVAVIGGGMAGICAAIAAARHGARVALVQDRPVLGGNASSEIRLCIRGASRDFPEYREGGILNELGNRNIVLNPTKNYPLWDAVLYGAVKEEKKISLHLNCVCIGAKATDGKIREITCRGLNNYTDYAITARIFVDCSGDCILAEYTGAELMTGREAKSVYGESMAPDAASALTMGNTCLMQAKERPYAVPYTPPPFARKVTEKEVARRMRIDDRQAFRRDNFWWLEFGGTRDTLADAEEIRDECLAAAYGVWDYVKNSGKYDSQNWELDFIGMIPGKRESRRYRGDYVLTQNDVVNATRFEDEVAYGGWPLDDHNALGFDAEKATNSYLHLSAPYAIPYRCLYSHNVSNLLFAGRNISVSHVAYSSTRVMATCAIGGQAAGTAAALCALNGEMPRALCKHVRALQDALLDDDCFLLHTRRASGEPERKLGDVDHAEVLRDKTPHDILFAARTVHEIRIVFDDDIARQYVPDVPERGKERQFPQRRGSTALDDPKLLPPPHLPEQFDVFVKSDGRWEKVFSAEKNYKRLVRIPVDTEAEGIRLVVKRTYGDTARIYAFEAI